MEASYGLLARLIELFECCVCLGTERRHAVLPCGHSVCTRCLAAVSACPLCRRPRDSGSAPSPRLAAAVWDELAAAVAALSFDDGADLDGRLVAACAAVPTLRTAMDAGLTRWVRERCHTSSMARESLWWARLPREAATAYTVAFRFFQLMAKRPLTVCDDVPLLPGVRDDVPVLPDVVSVWRNETVRPPGAATPCFRDGTVCVRVAYPCFSPVTVTVRLATGTRDMVLCQAQAALLMLFNRDDDDDHRQERVSLQEAARALGTRRANVAEVASTLGGLLRIDVRRDFVEAVAEPADDCLDAVRAPRWMSDDACRRTTDDFCCEAKRLYRTWPPWCMTPSAIEACIDAVEQRRPGRWWIRDTILERCAASGPRSCTP